MHVVDGHIGVVGGHFEDRALPEVARIVEDVGLVAEGEVTPSVQGLLEGEATGSFGSEPGVDRLLRGDLMGGSATGDSSGADIEAFGVLADHHEIAAVGSETGDRRRDTRIEPDRSQVDIEVEVESELE